ncbi:MAG: transporter substrate-binding domain-containing protein, partial [Nitrospirales bacterium]|nr:transporter substrate-binding domain-containing protein [Nitrospirales bacterium]
MNPIKTKIASFVFLVLILSLIPHQVTADSVSARVFSSSNAFTGDLSEIRKRRFLRVLVTYSKSNFFLMKGVPHGFEYEMLKQYEKFLNKGKGRRSLKTQLVFIPVPFDQLIPALLKGRGDIVASGLTNTPDRRKKVAFTTPYLPKVDEIVVS